MKLKTNLYLAILSDGRRLAFQSAYKINTAGNMQDFQAVAKELSDEEIAEDSVSIFNFIISERKGALK